MCLSRHPNIGVLQATVTLRSGVGETRVHSVGKAAKAGRRKAPQKSMGCLLGEGVEDASEGLNC